MEVRLSERRRREWKSGGVSASGGKRNPAAAGRENGYI